jgi:hypothetical protein
MVGFHRIRENLSQVNSQVPPDWEKMSSGLGPG